VTLHCHPGRPFLCHPERSEGFAVTLGMTVDHFITRQDDMAISAKLIH
jgi:hypothetical protein